MRAVTSTREHAQMWLVLNHIDGELGGAQDAVTLQGLGTKLAEQLRKHNDKEEENLFTQADKIVNSGQAGVVESLLDTHVMPTGWTAQGLG